MTWSKCEFFFFFFFLNKHYLTNYFDTILQHIDKLLYDKRETENNGWLVDWLVVLLFETIFQAILDHENNGI